MILTYLCKKYIIHIRLFKTDVFSFAWLHDCRLNIQTSLHILTSLFKYLRHVSYIDVSFHICTSLFIDSRLFSLTPRLPPPHTDLFSYIDVFVTYLDDPALTCESVLHTHLMYVRLSRNASKKLHRVAAISRLNHKSLLQKSPIIETIFCKKDVGF